MQAEHAAVVSTRGTALLYPWEMRSPTILLPLLFILADGVRCKDDAPAGGEFGEPCGQGSGPMDAELSCESGLECYIGYCEETCTDDSDCQPVEGYRHECEPDGLCHIHCDESSMACPQTLATTLECGISWCAGAS
ncbi:MAG: hypothetical protein IPN16_25015 [Gemmatimonadetes bacterium]|nr:hypothetical protein [Gemmatimonadota bacterium]